jgi:lycopene cyclase domain-containing protein
VSGGYLLFLLAAIGGMVLIDRRFRLFFWRDARRAAVVLIIGVLFFIAWDLVGIHLGIFARGTSTLATGIVLAPELPLEEPVFLTFLCYLIMVLVNGAARALSRGRKDTP